MTHQAPRGAVDDYVAARLIPEAAALEGVLAASADAGLPVGAIAASQGKLLELLARIRGARRILEIGTLGGYSAIWLARGLPADGRLITRELNARYAEVAQSNFAKLGLAHIIELRLGPALETLAQLVAENGDPFDLIFIDADKQNNPGYLDWSLRLARPGTVIVGDNVVRAGAILEPEAEDPRLGEGGIQGLRRFYEVLAGDPRLAATVIQTVTGKGHDGFALALVEDRHSCPSPR
jgi:predicted O-methyltransferase YrrM